jgi:hypothetical protein
MRASSIALAAGLLLLARAVPCAAQQADITAGIDRVRQTIPKAGLGERAEATLARLSEAEAAAKSGRLLLAIVRLYGPWSEAYGFAYLAEHAEVATASQAAFEREWRAAGRRMAAAGRRLDAPAPRTTPAAVLGLAQAARHQSGPFYESSRLYGLNTTLRDGLVYVGLASAGVDFAVFCRGLAFPAQKAAPRVPPLAAEIARLEALVVRGYQAAEDKDRRRYLELNASLKLAGELDRRGWREGALYKVLGAVREIGLLSARPDAPHDVAALRERAARASARVTGSPVDHSIAQLYLEMAETALEAGPEKASEAAVVLDAVLPRYFELLGEKP